MTITPDIDVEPPKTKRRQTPKVTDAPELPPEADLMEIHQPDVSFTPVIFSDQATSLRPDVAILPNMSVALDQKARPINVIAPVYPNAALRKGIEGDCEVRFDISAQGQALNVAVTCSDRLFEGAASRAVKRAKFSMAIKDGRPTIQTGMYYPVGFRLAD